MISPGNLSKRLVVILSFAALTMLAGCITSQDVLFGAATAPAKAGRYEVQYHVDGKWTKFATGSLALANRTYSWVEDREPLSLLKFRPDGLRFSLADIGNNYFIVVVAAGDLGNPTWIGNHMYGIARREGGTFLYDFPSCLDLLVSQGFTDDQIEKIKTHECHYSSKTSLIGALTGYAKRTVMWKRLAPSGY
jgi:hypothetical protein